ncbi:hypothetical protein [Devosia sp. LjRoot3]|uniref:hypothetical protein n=1 Tax=Devosia sp. LjRoot3 TaxID=3342319 RepID=UPI003ECD079F
MDTQSQVLTVEVEFEGQTYTASYFLEHGIIQASIEGRLFTAVKGTGPADETVRALLLEWLLQNTVRAEPEYPTEPSP